MKVWSALKSLFETTPPPPPPTREELQARLEKVRGYIRENEREINIGSFHSAKGCGERIARFQAEERRIKALLDSMP